mgnify:CR=1 FL=1
MPQHTILIVEDDNNQRALYQEEFHDEGYRVLAAADGREAIALAQQQHPDLVVLDINMPVMDGLDTLGHLLDMHNKMPIVINTAYASYQDSFTTWSADAYVVKSSDLSELKATVKRLLEERAQ